MLAKTSLNIIFFDSECVFCNFWVKKIIKLDQKKVFKVASLKGKTAAEYLPNNIINKTDSVVVLINQKIVIKSKAVIEIISQIGGFWKIFLIFGFLPTKILDFFYDFIAKRRFKWFGKQTECIMPDDRFLS